jgi:hypothetical protein
MSTDPATDPLLSTAQQAALRHVRSRALRERSAARRRIAAALDESTLTSNDVAALLAPMVSAPLALNFHPDRLAGDGRTVAQSMLEDGVYKSQFESRISNGGLTAFPGGDRDRWEERTFAGAYQQPGVAPNQRPKYGGLNVMNYPDGPCPRFGSCHLRLRREVLARTTFSFGDSHTEPRDLGTIDAFDSVLAGLLEATSSTGVALGRAETSVDSLIEVIKEQPSARVVGTDPPGRALDDYIEAQVHGRVELAADAEAIVADPSFRGTEIGHVLGETARRHGLELSWHVGFELDAAEVPTEFRGPAIPVIAQRIAREFGAGSPRLHAELIGRAARSVVTDPDRWKDWDTPAETLQRIKQLWHVLVQFGDESNRLGHNSSQSGP